ncbi:MAG: NDP-sugar synthase [Caldilinea sp. CFX5]|nr:NDP-sugar synthase [Caldilinea sp. CFX5]
MQGVILAAGKGKRLQPVTPARTKAMAPVAGKPIVARVLDLLVQTGVQELILLVSPDDGDIVPYFEQHTPPGVKITFVVQHERLGMAHALGLVAPHLHGDFIMSACDNLVPPEHLAAMVATHYRVQANATLSLMEIDIAESASTGIVEWQDSNNPPLPTPPLQREGTGERTTVPPPSWGRLGGGDSVLTNTTQRFIRRIVEKPQPAEAPSNVSSLPLYVFSPKILDLLSEVKPSKRGEYELQDAIQLLIDRYGGVTGVLTPVRWQLTNVADLLELNRHYLTMEAAMDHYPVDQRIQIIPPVRIDANCVLEAGCTVGPYVYLERGCRVRANARIENAILLRNAVVDAGAVITDAVVMHG